MIHAKYCYDSDPLDRWFEEEIEIEELMYWHLEKYFEPERIVLADQMYWKWVVHWGGYRITLGEMLNQPVRAVLNEKGIWVPDPSETFKLSSVLRVLINDVEVHRTPTTNVPVFTTQTGIWAARRLGNVGTPAAVMQYGDGIGNTQPDMNGLTGNMLFLAPLQIMGGKAVDKTIEFSAVTIPGTGSAGSISEIGLFTLTRTMIAREHLVTPIQRDMTDKLSVVWQITIN